MATASLQRFLFALTFVLALATHAADKKEPAASAPDMQKMMAMWAKLNQPGEPHAEFQKSTGTWKAEEKHFHGPDSFTAKGSSTFKTILGGRYILQEYKSESPMGKFEGMGITGYDNIKKRYVMTWMDNMSTGIVMATGVKKDKATNFSSRQIGPDGKSSLVRMQMREVSADKMIFTMWSKANGEKKYAKTMEITYTRVK